LACTPASCKRSVATPPPPLLSNTRSIFVREQCNAYTPATLCASSSLGRVSRPAGHRPTAARPRQVAQWAHRTTVPTVTVLFALQQRRAWQWLSVPACKISPLSVDQWFAKKESYIPRLCTHRPARGQYRQYCLSGSPASASSHALSAGRDDFFACCKCANHAQSKAGHHRAVSTRTDNSVRQQASKQARQCPT
jgi:hypothetical protein